MTFKEIADAVSTLGTLGFALLAVYAFLSERVVPRGRLEDAQKLIETERADKKEAYALARESIAASDRLADAVEERNRLEAAREMAELELAARKPPRRRA